jgi:flagellar biosynthesis protein
MIGETAALSAAWKLALSDPRQPDDLTAGGNPGPAAKPSPSALEAHLAGLDERRRQIAVALQYDERSGKRPRIAATGTGAVAEQILAAAFAAGVKVREDADLAEILAAIEVDSEIPLEALAAVAEILSYVYRANGAEAPREESLKEPL